MRQRVRRSQAGHGIARALWTGLATAGVLMVSGAHAVGLGEIRPQSVLNEALVAEIPLLDVKGLAAEDLRVRLADPAEFARIGVEPDAFLADFRFELDLAAAEPRVQIRSNRPVTEPFLNFLVALEWPQGRLLKEFTLLLDPPAYDESLAPSDSTSALPQANDRRPGLEDGATRRVTQVESGSSTLWRIATEHRPSRAVSVQQTMLAIQRLNPDAFLDNNINMLKAAQTLQLPDEAEAAAVSPSEAVEQVARQSDQWRASPRARSGTPGQIDATRPTAADKSELVAETDGRLEIVAGQADTPAGQAAPATSSPTAVEQGEAKTTTNDTSATPEALAVPLAADSGKAVAQSGVQEGGADVLTTPVTAALEETDRLSREVVELRAQLQAQEALARAQLEKRDRQLALLDQRVAALQAELDRLRSGKAVSDVTERSAESTGWTSGAILLSAGLAALVALLTAVLVRSRRGGSSAEQRRSAEDDDPFEPTFKPADSASGALAAAAVTGTSHPEKRIDEVADDRTAVGVESGAQVVDAERTVVEAPGEGVAEPKLEASIVANAAVDLATSTSSADAMLPDESITAAQPEAPSTDIQTLVTLSSSTVSAPASRPAAWADVSAAPTEAESAEAFAISTLRPEIPLETLSESPPVPPAAPANGEPDRILAPWMAEPPMPVDGGVEAGQVEPALESEGATRDVAAELTPLAITDGSDESGESDASDASDASEDEIDLIAEADIYVAYGRHARAVSLLEVALLEHPERHDVRLKLLEVLAHGPDIDAFQKVADAFLALCNDPELRAEALELQARVTGGMSNKAQSEDVDLSVSVSDAPSNPDVDFSIDWPMQPAAVSPADGEPDEASPLEPIPFASPSLQPSPPEAILSGAIVSETIPGPSEYDALELALLELEIDAPAERSLVAGPGSPRDEFDFLDAADSAETKLDLARAYREMGDIEGAREILGEVLADGNASQQQAAREILATLG